MTSFSLIRKLLLIRVDGRFATAAFYNFSSLNRKNMATNQVDTPLIPMKEVKRFMVDCMEAVGAPLEHAQALANLLAEADHRGIFSHGMNRLEMYVNDIKSGTCDPNAKPKILKESPSTAWVDGQNGLGPVVGNFCMGLAIAKAKNVGVGWVCAKESNHYGIASMYSLQALEKGLLGLSFTNTSPLMGPTRGKEAVLGTNPLSLAAPAENSDSFILDMATTTAAVGKIEMHKRKNTPIPHGWAQDSSGNSTTNPEDAACLMPVGGPEINSGYKGYGLAMLVEIFCGILSGSAYGPNIRKWTVNSTVANLGQCFIAVDPNCFAPGFEGRMSDLMNHIRSMEPADPNLPVLIPGDPEKKYKDSVDKAGGVKYVVNQMETCAKLAQELNIKPLQPLSL